MGSKNVQQNNKDNLINRGSEVKEVKSKMCKK